MKKYIIKNFSLILLVAAAVSCSKMNDLHQPFLDRGEKVYAARVDSAKAFIGINKQAIDIYVPNKRADRGVIKWNLGADSVEFTLVKPGPTRVVIENLEEGNYTYEIFTYDEFGNRSIGYEVTSNVLSTETMESTLESKKRSAYNNELDKMLAGKSMKAAAIKEAGVVRGVCSFKWDCDALPQAKVIVTYTSKTGSSKKKTFKGEDIVNGKQEPIVDAQTSGDLSFTHQTTYKLSQKFEVKIDLGEEYIDRYYDYSDRIEISKEFDVVEASF